MRRGMAIGAALIILGAGWARGETAQELNNRGARYYDLGRYAEAEPLYRRALESWKAAAGDTRNEQAKTLNAWRRSIAPRRAMRRRSRSTARRSTSSAETAGVESRETALTLNNVAELYRSEGRFVEAAAPARRAVELSTGLMGAEHPDTANCLHTLGGVLTGLKRFDGAGPLFERALDVREKAARAAAPAGGHHAHQRGGDPYRAAPVRGGRSGFAPGAGHLGEHAGSRVTRAWRWR